MKIFNWVQRRFHHNVLKDGLARNVKKTDSIAIDTNTKALLEQVALVDVLDGWRDGILAIGTFGFDPLKSFSEQKEYLAFDYEGVAAEEERYSDHNDDEEEDDDYDDDDDDDDNDENNSDDEVNPLIFSSLEDVESKVDDRTKYGKPEATMTVDGVAAGSTDHEIKFDFDATEGHSGKLRRRTTLADLFSEDSDMKKKKPCAAEFHSNSCKKSTVRTKNGLSFAKKLIPQVGDDSRPIKKLHQMMRRMLKRKIHPEIEGKGNKLDGPYKPSLMDVLGSKKNEAGESVSLLQSPDAVTV